MHSKKQYHKQFVNTARILKCTRTYKIIRTINCTRTYWNFKTVEIQYFFSYKTEFIPSKTIQKSRSFLQDGSRSLGLFNKGKTCRIAKFHRTDLVICSQSREGKTQSYSRINMVCKDHKQYLHTATRGRTYVTTTCS